MNKNELATYIGQMVLGAMNQALPAPSVRASLPSIREVIYNGPTTVINWSDGVKTVVKCHPEDTYDAKVGFLLCVMKRAYGNTGIYNHVLRDYCYGFDAKAIEVENTPVLLEEKKEEVYLEAKEEVPFPPFSQEVTHHTTTDLVEKLAKAIENPEEPKYTSEYDTNKDAAIRLSEYAQEECTRRAGEYSEVIPEPEKVSESEVESECSSEHYDGEKETPYHEMKETPFKSDEQKPFIDPEVFFEDLDEEEVKEEKVPNDVHYVPSDERIRKFIFQQV